MVNCAPMAFRQSSRSLFSALLLLALLMQALLPAVAAVRVQPQANWVEVCSVSGLQRIRVDQPQDTATHAAADHCVLCAASGAAPTFDASPFLRTGLSDVAPVGVTPAPVVAFPGHALLARAPPSFS